jgi:hypothetical protein
MVGMRITREDLTGGSKESGGKREERKKEVTNALAPTVHGDMEQSSSLAYSAAR